MELIKIIVEKIFKVKSWKQISMLCFLTTYLLLVYIVYENRDSILNFNKFDIPDSQVQYIQKDLEMEKILNKIMYNTKADRAYIVRFRPELGKNNLDESIKVYLTHEQTNTGVKSIKELYEGTLLTKFDTDWTEVYYEGNQGISSKNSKMYPFIEYHLEKTNIETFCLYAIYSDTNHVTHALILEFNDERTLSGNEKDLVRKYLNILGHYLK